jgi:hypothetical protein
LLHYHLGEAHARCDLCFFASIRFETTGTESARRELVTRGWIEAPPPGTPDRWWCPACTAGETRDARTKTRRRR